jgi:ribonuclease E
VKTPESMAIEVVRLLMLASQQPNISTVTVKVHVDVASYLNNKKRKEIVHLEQDGTLGVQILGSHTHYPEHLEMECRDGDGRLLSMPQ